MEHSSDGKYGGLPRFAGICSPADAMRPGLSVEESVRRLKRFHYSFKRLNQIMLTRLTAEPIYEIKTAFSYHAYLSAEHVAALRKRVGEMREPPLHLDAVPDDNLPVFFDEILASPDTTHLLIGLYEQAIPALSAALERYLSETNLLVDNPSVRVLKFAMIELAEMAEFGKAAIADLVDSSEHEKLNPWVRLLKSCLAASGGLDGAEEPAHELIARHYSIRPYVYDREPKRDARFGDPYNMGVNTEAIIYDDKFPSTAKILALFVKRYRELDVPEMMSSILVETQDKPWDYYLDLSRQLWDETRHALMGEAGLTSLGIDLAKVVIPFVWSAVLNTQLDPLERHGALYFIEQKLMAKTGKKYEWEVAIDSKDRLAILFQDFDWADEVLHARIGRTWFVSQFPNAQAAMEFADASSLKPKFDLELWQKLGLTEHRNWWPDLYGAACKHWGIEPEPKVLAFAVDYHAAGYSGPRFIDDA